VKENLQFAKVLKSLLEQRKLKPFALAKEIGVSHVAIGNFLAGQLPKSEHLLSLARFFDVQMEFLLTGEMVPAGKKSPKNWGGPYYGTSDEVPVVAWASAGGGGYYEDQEGAAERIKTNCKDPNCYAVKIEGDSMLPDFHNGDVAVAMPNVQPKNGDFVVAILKTGKVYFKKLKYSKDQKGIMLIPLNLNYDVLDYSLKEIDKLHPVHSTQRFLNEKNF